MIRADDIHTIPKESALYPDAWRALSDAPEALYAVGNAQLLSTRKLTAVGSRQISASAAKWSAETAKSLSELFTLVTGTAEGGDGAIAEGALAGSGNLICVLAGGFKHIPQGNYPILERVAKRGLLLSPHPFDTPVRNFSYEYRNKLLAALGDGTLVVSAGEKSGALITAKWARKFEKPLFALPYFPSTATGTGCNGLLKTGALLTESAEDIFAYFNLQRTEEKRTQPPLTAEEKAFYELLVAEGEAHAAALSQKTGVPVFRARAVLSSLEVKGLVTASGGNRYAATIQQK